MTGVQDADVYLLLLGPNYGAEMNDSAISATGEEFNTATTRGIPIYVFKRRGITPEVAQQSLWTPWAATKRDASGRNSATTLIWAQRSLARCATTSQPHPSSCRCRLIGH